MVLLNIGMYRVIHRVYLYCSSEVVELEGALHYDLKSMNIIRSVQTTSTPVHTKLTTEFTQRHFTKSSQELLTKPNVFNHKNYKVALLCTFSAHTLVGILDYNQSKEQDQIWTWIC